MRRFRTALFTAHALFVSVASLHAGNNNWPNWRGPNYDGSLDSVAPPAEWSGTKNVNWKVPVPGKGSGSPIVWDDQIILLTAIDTGEQSEGVAPPDPQAESGDGSGRRRRGRSTPTTEHEFVMISFDLSNGQERWRMVLNKAAPHEPGHETNTFASSSAVTDGQHIFASFSSNGIYCVDMQGELVWSKDLGRMRTRNQFGEGSSPALAGDTLVVPWDHEGQSSIYALDAATGEVRWKTERDERLGRPHLWSNRQIERRLS